MKKLILYLSFFILIFSCTLNRKVSLITHVSGTSILDTAHFEINYMKGKFYPLKIDLINNSDYPLIYWTWLCSWQSNWICSDKNVRLMVACGKNYPILVKLGPHESTTHYGVIIDTTGLIDIKEYNLGFVLIRKKEQSDVSYVFENLVKKIESRKDIYWSNSFEIGNKTSFGLPCSQGQ
jgi:hypothetical protein